MTAPTFMALHQIIPPMEEMVKINKLETNGLYILHKHPVVFIPSIPQETALRLIG
jgi:hypothetical protein